MWYQVEDINSIGQPTLQASSTLKLAYAGGLIAGLLLYSTVVAWHFGWAPQLGRPLVGPVYAPWDAIFWWRAWGHVEPYRSVFLGKAVTYASMVALAPLAIAWFAFKNGRLHIDQKQTNTGLGKPADLRGSGHIVTRGNGIVLGRDWWRVYRSAGDRHVFVFGESGAGKTTTTAIPTALIHTESLIVIDPGGGIAEATWRHRATLGPCFFIDPTKSWAARFNPLLDWPTDDRLIGYCETGAWVLVNGGKSHGPKDPFWEESAGYLVSGILHHVRFTGDPTLGHAYRVLQDIDANRYPMPASEFSGRIFAGIRKRDSKLRDSIVTQALTNLKFLGDPRVQHCISASDFRASDLQAAERPVTVSLTFPEDQAERLRPLQRLMLQTVLKPLMHDRRLTADGREKRRGALVIADDFPAMGYMEVMELVAADGRKYRLRLCLLAQNLEQLYKHYTENQSILGNCGTIALTPGFSEKTLRAAVTWGGKHSVAQASKQMSFGMRGNSSMGESEAQRNVLDPRDMLLRAKDEALVFTAGCKPTYLKKIKPWRDRAFRRLYQEVPLELAATASPSATTNLEELAPWQLTHRV
jgi:type IV secretory pathway TraG/TraD family ATPase VirD4